MILPKIKSNIVKYFNKKYPLLTLKLRHILKRGFEIEMELLPKFCNHSFMAIDIGANDGLYTYRLALLPQQVISFEPIPFLFNNLKNTFRKFPNIHIHKLALSNSTGEGTIYSPELMHGWSTLEKNNLLLKTSINHDKIIPYPIQITTLDSFNFAGVSFIKIDVEGHEFNVIQGARETIKLNRPILLIEIEERNKSGSVHQVIELIKDIDEYSVFYYFNRQLRPLSNANIRSSGTNNIDEHYINNFVFIHKSSDFFTMYPDLFSIDLK